MGFKDLEIFNDALLGKQAWRLVKGENTLLGKVMKAKYYHKSTFLEAPLGYSSSYSWRGIWSAKALIKEGMIWRLGNGTCINIWQDSWIVDEEGHFIQSPMVDKVTMVSDLITSEFMEWDLARGLLTYLMSETLSALCRSL